MVCIWLSLWWLWWFDLVCWYHVWWVWSLFTRNAIPGNECWTSEQNHLNIALVKWNVSSNTLLVRGSCSSLRVEGVWMVEPMVVVLVCLSMVNHVWWVWFLFTWKMMLFYGICGPFENKIFLHTLRGKKCV